jgi:hypothetical protein
LVDRGLLAREADDRSAINPDDGIHIAERYFGRGFGHPATFVALPDDAELAAVKVVLRDEAIANIELGANGNAAGRID